ncbi:hypothetical protein O9G_005795 [Rozella allomycis CSF55]|uniref:Uncharacterized protein n=1 Tax=Rozella allomycis (strain CSF55) TaxID=988480 RepID=A0A075B285_ROZAC|nr:hypothetical protein O9G_005795 [Rozella allomycis CSF55]|eukprot:EPZ36486.1 hypothetical protein O9G_005795 [Rozella allomycis CSF55]
MRTETSATPNEAESVSRKSDLSCLTQEKINRIREKHPNLPWFASHDGVNVVRLSAAAPEASFIIDVEEIKKYSYLKMDSLLQEQKLEREEIELSKIVDAYYL